MQELFNIGVVGCGYWGPNIIRNLNALPEANVKTVCDEKKERLNYMRDLY